MVLKFFKTGYLAVKNAFSKTGSLLGNKLRNLFHNPIDEETLEHLEEILYEADLGVKTAMELTEKIKGYHKENSALKPNEYIDKLKEEVIGFLGTGIHELAEAPKDKGPTVILFIGVNGAGKTGSVAKISHLLVKEGKKVLVAAADTFRAGAIDQLEVWAGRLGLDIVRGKPGSDPSAVAFDAITAGKARGCDYILIDTAGRLQNKTHLMQELEKIKRTCNKVIPEAPHEILLILDANTGQNGLDQALIFRQYTPITGLVVTKLDGTAKGGIVIGAQRELGIPIKFISFGEGEEDIKPFETREFVDALFD